MDFYEITEEYKQQMRIKYYNNNIKVNTNHLKILYMNVRSIRNKFDEIQALLACIESEIRQGIDVVIMTESWLNRDEVNFFNISDYDAYHSLRDGRGYGGISVYVKKHILTNVLETSMKKVVSF
jgi:exonuclease III